jgi:hypothetical protein
LGARLVTDHGFAAKYASVMRFVRRLRGERRRREPFWVIETEPGREGQVDYGEGPMVRDAVTGKYRRARLFVLTLRCTARRRARQSARGRPQARRLRSRANPLYRYVVRHYGVVFRAGAALAGQRTGLGADGLGGSIAIEAGGSVGVTREIEIGASGSFASGGDLSISALGSVTIDGIEP